ncbi:stress response protein NST1-like isoform X2 [Acropora millepora]|uniref:stress response protein NST1-like isoform X2 n=1 Tax=Acropora millepora TaxID=45264 RepID=UPI001CF2D8CA|nr:stress response protein NST1-like isoform X2 [Acropora millepora]
MADNLVKLIILLLFISFRPISSNSVKNQEEINVADQHVKEELAAGEPSRADPQDQAQVAENVDNVKGQGKPGFFSQILSDLMAPRYNEEDFDPDDSSGESFIENQEEASAAESGHKNPVGDQDHGPVVPVKKQPLDSIVPTFVASHYFKSVNENSLTAQTVMADVAKEKSVSPEVTFAPHVTFVKSPPSVGTVHNNEEASNNIRDQNSDNIDNDHLRDDQDSHRDSMGEELSTQAKSELSDEDLEHLRVKRKGLTKEKDETPEIRDKDPVMEEAGEGSKSNPEGGNEFESAVAGENQTVVNDNLELTVMNTDKELDKSKMSSESEGFAKGQDNKEAMPVNSDQLAFPETENSDATEGQNDRADQQQPVAKTPSIVANSNEESSLKESENGGELDPKTKRTVVVDMEADLTESFKNVAKEKDRSGVKANERKVDLDQEKGADVKELKDERKEPQILVDSKDESDLKANERKVDLDQEKGADVKELKDERKEPQILVDSKDESDLNENEGKADLDQEKGDDVKELKDERRESQQSVANSKDESVLTENENRVELDDQKEEGAINDEEKNADHGTEEELEGSRVMQSYDKRAVHKDTKNLKEQEEMDKALREKLRKQLEEEEELEEKLRIAAERKRKMEEEERQRRLDNLRKQLDEMDRSEVKREGKTSVETPSNGQVKVHLQDAETDEQNMKVKMKQNRNDPSLSRVVNRIQKDPKLPIKNDKVQMKAPPRPLKNGAHQNNKQQHSNGQKTGKSNGKGKEDWKLNKERFDQEKAELQKKKLEEDRRMYEKLKQEYKLTEQQKVQRSEQSNKQIPVMQNPRPLLRKPKVPPKVDQVIPASETSRFSTWTPTPSILDISPTRERTITSSTSTSLEATTIVVSLKERVKPSASFAEESEAASIETPMIFPSKVHESQGPIVTQPIFDPKPPVENTGEGKDATPSPLAVFMKTFRNFHTVCYEKILLYWPVVRHTTRSVLAKVGLESMFDQTL